MPHVVHENEPAQNRQAVTLCCDDRYLPYAAFVADALADQNPDRDFDIVLCSLTQLNVPAALLKKGVRFCQIDTDGAFSGLFLNTRFTESVYLRLALPQAFEDVYDRLLYLDCDVFVQSGDVSALLQIDMQGYAIGAVRDNIQWRSTAHKPAQFKKLGWDNMPYFNSGVLLIDCASYIAEDIAGQCAAFGQEHKDKMVVHDQGLLNCVLRGHWLELSPVWNWQYTLKTSLLEAASDIHVVHFIRATKPWNDEKGELAPRFAREMSRYLKKHFPDHPPVPFNSGQLCPPPKFRQMLQRHWLRSFQLYRYVGKFSDDLSAIPL